MSRLCVLAQELRGRELPCPDEAQDGSLEEWEIHGVEIETDGS
jgi:hypothetical protein